MPAPKLLSWLPKPVLFGLYGAIGGLLGALVIGEPLYHLLAPPPAAQPPQPAKPEPQVAIAASPEVEVHVDGRNTFPIQIARDAFDGPVMVRFEGLPAGVTAATVTIAGGKTQGKAVVVGTSAAKEAKQSVKLIAEATADGKTATAETSIGVRVSDPPRPRADIVFVLDVTSSMQWALDDLRNGIGKFTDALKQSRVGFRLGLVTFQDVRAAGGKVEVVRFTSGNTTEPFTDDAEAFRRAMGRIKIAIGSGGDVPESSLEAVTTACQLPFRQDATKLLLLITDAPPKVAPGRSPEDAVADTAAVVRKSGIDAVYTVALRFDEQVYGPLSRAEGEQSAGRFFDLRDVVVGEDGFDRLLATFGTEVAKAALAKSPESKPRIAGKAERPTLPGVKGLVTTVETEAGSERQLVLQTGLWSGAIAALICLALLAGQTHYLRGAFPGVGGTLLGFWGGLAVGVAGGAAGQGLFFLAPDNPTLATVFRVVGWALLGGLAGLGLSLFIPNMKKFLGLVGGAVGGAAGAVGFIAVESTTGGLAGRLVGGLILGFSIGLMVAIVEAAFRRVWLEVRYGSRETIAVNLGPEPVKVGGDARACTVWARGAAPVALRFFIRDGEVICDDRVMKRETTVGDGFAKEVGNVTVTVRSGSGSGGGSGSDSGSDSGSGSGRTAPPPVRPAAPPPERVQQPPARQLRDEDDGFDLPMPMSPASPTVTPPPPPTVPPTPPKRTPVSTPTPVPRPGVPPMPVAPPKPAPKSGTGKHPDACPGCGRVNAGKPGHRYCVVCDNTY